MYPYNATDAIRVMNTDLAEMLERDRWRRARPEIYPPEFTLAAALLGLRRRLSRTPRAD